MNAVVECLGRAGQSRALVLSNIELRVPEGCEFRFLDTSDEAWPEWLLEATMRQVAAKRGTEVLLDDVGVVLNAREWHTFPAALQTAFCATRKAKCNFNWTAQYPAMVDKALRMQSRGLHRVTAYPEATEKRREQGKRPWWFVIRRYMPEHEDQKDYMLGRWLVRYRREYEALYDTDQIIWPMRYAGLAARLGLPVPRALGWSGGELEDGTEVPGDDLPGSEHGLRSGLVAAVAAGGVEVAGGGLGSNVQRPTRFRKRAASGAVVRGAVRGVRGDVREPSNGASFLRRVVSQDRVVSAPPSGDDGKRGG
jgi:hypothetical protein